MSEKIAYRVRNWSQYNRSLINRGNVTLWFDEASLANWSSSKERRGRGRPEEFSDTAIECCLVLRSLFHLPLRATQGFVEGMIQLFGLQIAAPHYTLVCKRAGSLNIDLKALPQKGALHVVVDSTGLKVYGEGEWKTRCHGKSKRREWKKLHLAVNAKTHEIIGCSLTDSNVHDCDAIEAILPEKKLGKVCADGAYDNEKSYAAVDNRDGIPVIPPRSGAACKLKKPSPAMALRNHTVRACWKMGKKSWKVGSGYHQRSLAETAMMRFKTILGAHLSSRKMLNQITEARLKSQILNRMTQLGMPISYKIS